MDFQYAIENQPDEKDSFNLLRPDYLVEGFSSQHSIADTIVETKFLTLHQGRPVYPVHK